MKKILFLLITIFVATGAIAHPWKPRHYVIADTEGSDEDMRALTMLLSSPDIRVLAITVSSGSMNSDAAYKKISKLLIDFHHEGMYIGIGSQAKSEVQSDRISNQLIISRVLENEQSMVTLVCLAGLKTAADILAVPGYRRKIKQIVISADSRNYITFSDPKAVETVLKSDIPVAVVGDWKGEFFDSSFVNRIRDASGIYAEYLSRSFNNIINKASDEMVPVYIRYPALFLSGNENSYTPDQNKKAEFQSAFLKIISGETVERNQVLREMPSEPSFYFADLEPYVTRIIDAYGKDEWSSGVLANELHRHLGTFAIIGVKMGIRAREYFNTGVDEFTVVSFAGSTPPMSCLNDGLQVSTGATPGHGLLKVEDKGMPMAEIRYKDRYIRIALRTEIADTISSELKRINFIYGLDSDIYWELVRKNTIKYWLDLDRHDIFKIEEL
ncbi:MAG TPA: FmdE family protein [Bacteroidales bacterium]|nr:FmdE family protein [Bacteroidales bacterium]